MTGLEGKTLGPYRVIAQIGVGGMAKIYKAYQPSMERMVALKVLPEEYAQEPQFIERFCQEARTIAQLEHRNILPVYDFGEQDGVAYLAMRLLDGGTLKEWMKSRRPMLHETAEMLAQVCAALDYAHRRGVIHRDVKPSNVMIDREGAVYLSDFGIAKVLESASHLTQTGAALGTPAYMSPEQCTGSPVDARSDIYSLGVVLYEMTVGRVPFQADTPMAVLLAHLHEALPIPRSINPHIPEEMQNVILKAMAKDPHDRYPTAAEMGRALRRAAPPEEEPAAPKPAAGETLPARLVPPQAPQAAQSTPALAGMGEAPGSEEPAAPSGPSSSVVATSVAPEEQVEEPGAPSGPSSSVVATSVAPDEQAESGAALPAAEEGAAGPAARSLPEETVMQPAAAPARARKRRPAALIGWGLAAALLVAGMAGGLFLALRGRPPQPTPNYAMEPATQAPPASPTDFVGGSTARPALTASPRATGTRRPADTPQATRPPNPQPVMFDDFENPAFEGRLNPDLWELSGPPDCLAVQQKGVLSLGNRVRSTQMDCTLGMKVPIQAAQRHPSMQAMIRVNPDLAGAGAWTALVWTGIIPATDYAPPGEWRVECGVFFNKTPRVSMDIVDTRMGADLAHQVVTYMDAPIKPDAWTPLRLQAEPETMTFSCWMGDQLVGMYNPVSEQEALRRASFQPSLAIIRPPGSRMTVEVGDFVFLPGELLPRAAEAARPAEGCLPPPEGIVGWWTGDSGLENQVYLGKASPEGDWGFAKGMVGQAFAFQNFPGRLGLFGIPSYPALINLQNVTVEGWVRLDAGPYKEVNRFLTLGEETLVIRQDGRGGPPGTLHFFMKIDGELRATFSPRLMKAGIFYHVSGTYDGKTMKLYLNGALVNSLPVKGVVAAAVNGVMLSGGEVLDGLLDEFTLYNRALSAGEIGAIFQAGAAGKCRR